MKVITAPEPLYIQPPSVFLAGSIEQDTAAKWQDTLISLLARDEVTVLNPRRKEWDRNWDQSIQNPEFKRQVEWELVAMDHADLIVIYFDPATKSPVTLLEFGLFASSEKLVVCCPEGFWRKGNVDVVCGRYGIQQVPHLEIFPQIIRGRLLQKAP